MVLIRSGKRNEAISRAIYWGCFISFTHAAVFQLKEISHNDRRRFVKLYCGEKPDIELCVRTHLMYIIIIMYLLGLYF